MGPIDTVILQRPIMHKKLYRRNSIYRLKLMADIMTKRINIVKAGRYYYIESAKGH